MGSKYKRRRMSITIVAWIVLSLFIIVGSSIILVATFRKSREESFPNTRPNVQATSTPMQTKSAPIITGASNLTQTPTQLFYEDFTDNSKGWALTDSPDFTRMLEGDKLTLAVTNHKILTETVPTGMTFGDCTIAIGFTLLKADTNDSVGVYVRGDGLLFHDYRIDIFGNNTVALSKEYLDAEKKQQTLEFEKTSHIAALASIGKGNTLVIIMKGPYIMVQINGTTIKTIIDTDYPRGQVALFVNNGATSDGAAASFSNVQITEAPDQLPGLPISATATVLVTP